MQLSFAEGSQILLRHGLKLLPSHAILTSKDLARAEKALSYPVILKVYAQTIVHKAKEGFVQTGIRNKEELSKSYSIMVKRALSLGAKDFHFIAQDQVFGVEFIVGAKKDDVFGEVVLFGLGGIFTESFNKISMRVCPLTVSMADEMVLEITDHKAISENARKKISHILLAISQVIKKEHVMEIDLNPLIVNGDEVSLVDVRMVR